MGNRVSFGIQLRGTTAYRNDCQFECRLSAGIIRHHDQSADHSSLGVPGLRANDPILPRFVGSDDDALGGLTDLGMNMCFRTSLDLPHVNDLPDVLQSQGKNLSRSDRDLSRIKTKIMCFHLDHPRPFRQFLDSGRCRLLVMMSVSVFRNKRSANLPATEHLGSVVRIVHRRVRLNPGRPPISECHRTMRLVKGCAAGSVLLEVSQQRDAYGLKVAPGDVDVIRLRNGAGGRDSLGIRKLLRQHPGPFSAPAHRIPRQRFLNRDVVAHCISVLRKGGVAMTCIIMSVSMSMSVFLVARLLPADRLAAATREPNQKREAKDAAEKEFPDPACSLNFYAHLMFYVVL